MVRLLRVALGGVGALVCVAIAGVGLLMVLGLREPGDHGAMAYVAWVVLTAGAAGFLAFGGFTLYMVVDWRRRRGDSSPRP
jgi:hypothetical protein